MVLMYTQNWLNLGQTRQVFLSWPFPPLNCVESFYFLHACIYNHQTVHEYTIGHWYWFTVLLFSIKVKGQGWRSNFASIFQSLLELSIFIVESPTKCQNVCLTKFYRKRAIHFSIRSIVFAWYLKKSAFAFQMRWDI